MAHQFFKPSLFGKMMGNFQKHHAEEIQKVTKRDDYSNPLEMIKKNQRDILDVLKGFDYWTEFKCDRFLEAVRKCVNTEGGPQRVILNKVEKQPELERAIIVFTCPVDRFNEMRNALYLFKNQFVCYMDETDGGIYREAMDGKKNYTFTIILPMRSSKTLDSFSEENHDLKLETYDGADAPTQFGVKKILLTLMKDSQPYAAGSVHVTEIDSITVDSFRKDFKSLFNSEKSYIFTRRIVERREDAMEVEHRVQAITNLTRYEPCLRGQTRVIQHMDEAGYIPAQ